ncbi:hypothetical protein LTR49_021746 [Elasticomyces elasticus]|nr:hypothetical protein LTR49_021746 [Elasticomyces elasticus]
MLVRKLQSSAVAGIIRPTLHDIVIFAYSVFDYQPTHGSQECKGFLEHVSRLSYQDSNPLWLQQAILTTGGGMTAGERAIFLVTIDEEAREDRTDIHPERSQILSVVERLSIQPLTMSSDLHLRAINHTLQTYRPDAYDSLPPLQEAIQRIHEWHKMESAFKAVKPVFAEYNKWDEYGIVLLFRDMDMAPNQRLVDIHGTTTPWLGDLELLLERALSPRTLRLWEGQLLPYSFYLERSNAAAMHDITFEQEAASWLGGLGLVRLDTLKERASDGCPEVEIEQGLTTTIFSPELSYALLQEGVLTPIMWEFRRVREGPSDRYRPMATRFRTREWLSAALDKGTVC